MNACQLLFLLEAKRFEKPPFQGHVSICSKSGERNKTTKKQNKTKKEQERKKNHTNIKSRFLQQFLLEFSRRIHPHAVPFCAPLHVHARGESPKVSICVPL